MLEPFSRYIEPEKQNVLSVKVSFKLNIHFLGAQKNRLIEMVLLSTSDLFTNLFL